MPTFVQRLEFGTVSLRHRIDSGSSSAGAQIGGELVGGATCWSDGSDATYARMVATKAAGVGGSRRFDYAVAAPPSFPPARPAEVPGTATRSAPVVYYRAKRGQVNSGTGTDTPQEYVTYGTTTASNLVNGSNPIGVGPPDGAGIQQFAILAWPPPGSTFVHTINYAPADPGGGATSAEWLVYAMWTEYTWTWTDLTKPVARLYPRDDGKGASSAPRMVPPPRAARLVGGHQ